MKIRRPLTTVAAASLAVASSTLGLLAQPASAAPVAGSSLLGAGTLATLTANALPGSPVVNQDSPAGQIKAVQTLLGARGHATTVDGQWGPNTTAAVKAFQTSVGLDADGVPGPDTLGALVATVHSGDTGAYAKAAQYALTAAGYSITVDGNFGPASTAAAKSFQSKSGLTADGIVGDNTWSKLFDDQGSTSTPVNSGDCSTVTKSVPISDTVSVAPTIRVNKCMAGNVSALLAAAKKAGITLTASSSYRTIESQIALRKAHCGTTYYDIWQKPSNQCSPATAIPGRSLHERGLAIDFANCSKGSARYNWLVAHAASYHLYNLPSESWHWSYTGH